MKRNSKFRKAVPIVFTVFMTLYAIFITLYACGLAMDNEELLEELGDQ